MQHALWMGIKVIDDTHENKGSGWDGDSVQVAFSPAASWTDGSKRTGTEILYTYGLVCRRH